MRKRRRVQAMKEEIVIVQSDSSWWWWVCRVTFLSVILLSVVSLLTSMRR